MNCLALLRVAVAWSIATHAVAVTELRPLEVSLVGSEAKTRFISPDEMKFLGSFTDCPDLDVSGHGPATHPVIRVKFKDVHVTVQDEARVIPFSLPADVRHPDPAREWVVRKVVCGSRGYAVLYADVFATKRKFVLNRYDPQWRLVASDIFSLPELSFSGYSGGTLGGLVWRFAERPEGFTLVVLDVLENKDRTINRADYVALAQHEFRVLPREDTARGYADRPGPLLTPEFLARLPLPIMPGVEVPRDVERHEVKLGNWSETTHVHVDVAGRTVFLVLKALHPIDWQLSVARGTRLAAVHLSGPPPQNVTGLPEHAVVLRFSQQGGTRDQASAYGRLSAHTEPARSVQEIPAHRKYERVLVDGTLGAMQYQRRNIHHPEMPPDTPADVQARIAICAALKNQDDRIECYRLRAIVLRGGQP